MNIADIVKNKETLIAQKKATIKHADGITFGIDTGIGQANKAVSSDSGVIQVKAVINTTNLLDSHSDVHIKGIWNKSLKENKQIMHLQEHEMKFDKIISKGNDLKASAVDYTWKELGYNFKGTTQALVFDSTIKVEQNPAMYKEYKAGNVTNHSVGMQYVKLELAVNNEDYKEEFAVWNKYYSDIANKETADAQGYFWAVKEARVIEGSAVPLGSNYATPTLEIEAADKSTSITEPPVGTLDVKEFRNLIKNVLK